MHNARLYDVRCAFCIAMKGHAMNFIVSYTHTSPDVSPPEGQRVHVHVRNATSHVHARNAFHRAFAFRFAGHPKDNAQDVVVHNDTDEIRGSDDAGECIGIVVDAHTGRVLTQEDLIVESLMRSFGIDEDDPPARRTFPSRPSRDDPDWTLN
jgi:hypothetical protein